jgi:hypothetical protein
MDWKDEFSKTNKTCRSRNILILKEFYKWFNRYKNVKSFFWPIWMRKKTTDLSYVGGKEKKLVAYVFLIGNPNWNVICYV